MRLKNALRESVPIV
uniref:Uncharacterized protein n=1 Tax=Rhizophora mucronata TaxID=61149 RepID=A0A2P2M3X9_RHIMU